MKDKEKTETNDLILKRPTAAYADQVMAYKREMLENGDRLDGCAALEECETYAEWAAFESRLKAKFKDSYVPSEVFLAVRQSDDRVVGILDFKHPLSGFLLKFGGNIGYSVRPDERGKGYAAEMLKQILPICREYGEERVLLTCDKENIASAKTILKNGGILENEVADTPGLGKSGVIMRYWINTAEKEETNMRLWASHPVFPTPDICKTAEFYEKKLGFRRVDYLNAQEKHICLYRDDVEFILTQSNGQKVIPNRKLYGYGGDAYVIVKDQLALQEEYEQKGVKIAQHLHKTDYHNQEFVVEDIDGRWIYFGLKE